MGYVAKCSAGNREGRRLLGSFERTSEHNTKVNAGEMNVDSVHRAQHLDR